MKRFFKQQFWLLTLLLLGTSQAGQAAVSQFDQSEINSDRFLTVAAPAGRTGYQLLILEQVKDSRPCWNESGSNPTIVEPLLLQFDFTGICGRSIDSNGYSLRAAGEDQGLRYSLRIMKQQNDLVLVAASNTVRNLQIPIGRSYGLPAPGEFVQIQLDPGWRLTRRTFNGRTIGHVYLTNDQPISYLVALATSPPGTVPPVPSLPTVPNPDGTVSPTLPSGTTPQPNPGIPIPVPAPGSTQPGSATQPVPPRTSSTGSATNPTTSPTTSPTTGSPTTGIPIPVPAPGSTQSGSPTQPVPPRTNSTGSATNPTTSPITGIPIPVPAPGSAQPGSTATSPNSSSTPRPLPPLPQRSNTTPPPPPPPPTTSSDRPAAPAPVSTVPSPSGTTQPTPASPASPPRTLPALPGRSTPANPPANSSASSSTPASPVSLPRTLPTLPGRSTPANPSTNSSANPPANSSANSSTIVPTVPAPTNSPTAPTPTTTVPTLPVAPGSVPSNETAAAPGQSTPRNAGYRVIVDANTAELQDRVRSVVPQAQIVTVNGQVVMQAGLFRDLGSAEQLRQKLLQSNLSATVVPIR